VTSSKGVQVVKSAPGIAERFAGVSNVTGAIANRMLLAKVMKGEEKSKAYRRW